MLALTAAALVALVSAAEHLARGGELRILADGVSVLDTGDHDGDGESELVAMQSGTEGGSTMLFWDGFRRQARFDWLLGGNE